MLLSHSQSRFEITDSDQDLRWAYTSNWSRQGIVNSSLAPGDLRSGEHTYARGTGNDASVDCHWYEQYCLTKLCTRPLNGIQSNIERSTIGFKVMPKPGWIATSNEDRSIWHLKSEVRLRLHLVYQWCLQKWDAMCTFPRCSIVLSRFPIKAIYCLIWRLM